MTYINKLAFRYVKTDKNKSWLLSLTIVFSAFILSLTLSFSASNQIVMQKTMKYMPQITILNQKNGLDELESDSDIEKIVTFHIIENTKIQNNRANIVYLDNHKYFNKIEGDIPKSKNEIMLENDIAKKLKVKIGDTITIETQNGEVLFKVAAIAFRDLEVSQVNIYVSENLFKELDAEISSSMIFLQNKMEQFAYNKVEELEENLNIPKENIGVYSEYFTYAKNKNFENIPLEVLFVLLLIAITTALVLYSIYYISINKNINELGKLRALGFKIKDVRKLLLRQAQILSIPSGMVGAIFGIMINSLIRAGTFSIHIHGIIFLASIVFTYFITLLSTLKPAIYGSKVSPIEALTYSSYKQIETKKHKTRKVTPAYLGILNAERNKKRSVYTLISLTLCSMLFISIIGIYSSISTEKIAKSTRFKHGEYNIALDSSGFQVAEPKDSDFKNAILQAKKNPINKSLIDKLDNINSVYVNRVEKATTVRFNLEKYGITNQVSTIVGYKDVDVVELKSKMIDGNLVNENDIIINNANNVFEEVYKNTPLVGDEISIMFRTKEGDIKEELFIVGGVIDDPSSSYIFALPEHKFDEYCDYNCNYKVSLKLKDDINKDQIDSTESLLTRIIAENDNLELNTIGNYVLELNNQYKTILISVLVLTSVILIFAMFNIINLSITTFIERKNQMGTMMALGMKKNKFTFSRIIESQIIMILANIISIGLGLIAGKKILDILGQSIIKFSYTPNIKLMLTYIIMLQVLGVVVEFFITRSVTDYELIKYIEG